MPESSLTICNEALALLGADPLTSWDEANDRKRLCAALYEPTRDAVLRAHPWNFAVARAAIAPLQDAPAFGFSAYFPFPADLLRLLEVDGTDEFQVEGRGILCDAAALNIRYVSRIEDVSKYDSMFCSALAAFLAAKMAYPITKSNTTAQTMLELYKGIIVPAKSVDAQENPAKTMGDFPFLQARRR